MGTLTSRTQLADEIFPEYRISNHHAPHSESLFDLLSEPQRKAVSANAVKAPLIIGSIVTLRDFPNRRFVIVDVHEGITGTTYTVMSSTGYTMLPYDTGDMIDMVLPDGRVLHRNV